MNKEIGCITNKLKKAKNEWENDDSDFFRALYSVHKNIRTPLFPYLLVNLFLKKIHHFCENIII